MMLNVYTNRHRIISSTMLQCCVQCGNDAGTILSEVWIVHIRVYIHSAGCVETVFLYTIVDKLHFHSSISISKTCH